MEKKYTVTLRLSYQQYAWLGALCRRSKQTQSEVIRESLRLLREKQAESRLQALRDMLAEGLSSGEAQPWEKDAFLRKVKAGIRK